ncbi:MAG: HAD family hydrolase [Christensenellales bacterium]|jgi:phosphoglycolate phosphatase
MKQKKYILFDLDGTITDSGIGITKSVLYALDFFGVPVGSLDELRPFIGPPLKDSFMELYGFSEEKAAQAIAKYREYFSVTGLYENELYPGIPELLKELKAAGKKVLLSTSKAEIFTNRIIKHFGIAQFFDFVAGSELDGRRTDKAEIIAHALSGAKIADPSLAVMIGDRKHDIIGAKKHGMDSIGVLYGYGSLEELKAAGADETAATVAELSDLLL